MHQMIINRIVTKLYDPLYLNIIKMLHNIIYKHLMIYFDVSLERYINVILKSIFSLEKLSIFL